MVMAPTVVGHSPPGDNHSPANSSPPSPQQSAASPSASPFAAPSESSLSSQPVQASAETELSQPSPPPAANQPEPVAQCDTFIHSLIGLSPGGFAETVRNSISSLTWKDTTSTGAKTDHHAPDLQLDHHDHEQDEPRPRHLLNLPPEILFMILYQLDFADIVRLRKTCKQLHTLANPHQIRILMGPAQLRTQLLGHCKTCLLYDPFRSRLIRPDFFDPAYPLASRCVDCALKARDPLIRVGRKLKLANLDSIWVCRYCSLPVTDGAAFGHEQFHRSCYKRYNDQLFLFFVMGWIQLSLGIVAAVLAWRYYRHSILVFAPTVTNFLLLWICLAFIVFRGNRRRTYHFTLVLELAILGLWIPPMYYLATDIAGNPDAPVSKSTKATLAMFALNMLFRLLNSIGNTVLLFRPSLAERHRYDVPFWKKSLYYLGNAFVVFTYPQSLEEKIDYSA